MNAPLRSTAPPLAHRMLIAALSATCGLTLTAPTAAEETLETPGGFFFLEEVLVTATRRTESLQTVGLSLTALSGDELQARGTADFEDYAVAIPNLAFGATDDGILANRTISVRGIEGLNTTSFYIDDVPLDESVDPLVLDVERIEVLRGPQGTLYGARGLGGTIRVITRRPEFDSASARLNLTTSHTKHGDLNYGFDGAFNLPLADNAAIRLLGYYQREAGIFDLVVGPATAPGVSAAAGAPGAITGDPADEESNVDDKATYGAQLAFRWAPNEVFTADARALYQKTDLDGFPLADQAFAAAPEPFKLRAGDLTQNRLFNVPEGGEDEWAQFSLTLAYDAEFGSFTSSTGYFTRDTFDYEDSSEFVSFTLLGGILPSFGLPTAPAPVASPIFQTLEFNTFAQEVRFASSFKGPFQMIAGAFYQDTDDHEAFQPENIAPGFGAAFDGFLRLPPGTSSDLIFTSDTIRTVEEIGLFGEFSYDLTDRFTATIGLRYFDTEVFYDDYNAGFAAGGVLDLAPGTQKEDGVNLKFLLEYQQSDRLFLFASAAEGFRIGGVNRELSDALGCETQLNALGLSKADGRTYDSDKLWSYELGAKFGAADQRYTFNASAFYVDFDELQQRVLLACGFDLNINGGAARSLGFEAEFNAQPADGLWMQLAAGYTDAEFTETVPGGVNDGDPLQQVPEWTFSAAVDYERPAFGDFNWFMRGDFAHVGSSISTVVDSGNPRIRPSFNVLNVRIGLRSPNYRAALFVDNLLNEEAVYSDNRTLAAEAAGRPRIVRNRPVTVGLNLGYDF